MHHRGYNTGPDGDTPPPPTRGEIAATILALAFVLACVLVTTAQLAMFLVRVVA